MAHPTTPSNTVHRSERGRRFSGPREIPVEPYALLSGPDIQYLTGVSRVTLYRWLRSGHFPPPDRVLPGDRQAWRRATYDAWATCAA